MTMPERINPQADLPGTEHFALDAVFEREYANLIAWLTQEANVVAAYARRAATAGSGASALSAQDAKERAEILAGQIRQTYGGDPPMNPQLSTFAALGQLRLLVPDRGALRAYSALRWTSLLAEVLLGVGVVLFGEGAPVFILVAVMLAAAGFLAGSGIGGIAGSHALADLPPAVGRPPAGARLGDAAKLVLGVLVIVGLSYLRSFGEDLEGVFHIIGFTVLLAVLIAVFEALCLVYQSKYRFLVDRMADVQRWRADERHAELSAPNGHYARFFEAAVDQIVHNIQQAGPAAPPTRVNVQADLPASGHFVLDAVYEREYARLIEWLTQGANAVAGAQAGADGDLTAVLRADAAKHGTLLVEQIREVYAVKDPRDLQLFNFAASGKLRAHVPSPGALRVYNALRWTTFLAEVLLGVGAYVFSEGAPVFILVAVMLALAGFLAGSGVGGLVSGHARAGMPREVGGPPAGSPIIDVVKLVLGAVVVFGLSYLRSVDEEIEGVVHVIGFTVLLAVLVAVFEALYLVHHGRYRLLRERMIDVQRWRANERHAALAAPDGHYHQFFVATAEAIKRQFQMVPRAAPPVPQHFSTST